MDALHIPPTELSAFLAERTERIDKARPDRDHRPPGKRQPKRRRREPAEAPADGSEQTGRLISVDA